MKKHLDRTGFESVIAHLADTHFSMHMECTKNLEQKSKDYHNYLRFIVLFLCQGRGMMDRLAIHMQV